MIRDLLQPTHLLVICAVFVVLFGGRKLGELGKGLGDGIREFKRAGKELSGAREELNK